MRRRRRRRWGLSVVLALVCLLLLSPAAWMISGSLQPITGILRMPPALFPPEASLANYRQLLSSVPLMRWAVNSVASVAVTVALSAVVSATAALAFAYGKFRYKGLLWAAVLATLMIPRMSLVVPHYLTARVLHLANSPLAAAYPLVFHPVGIVLFRLFLESIPHSITEAAFLDGATTAATLRYVLAPLCGPAFAVVGVFQSMAVLGDYLWQSLVLVRPGAKTALVGLIQAVSLQQGTLAKLNPIGASLAAGTLLFVPLVALFALFSRAFLEGLTTGGVKG